MEEMDSRIHAEDLAEGQVLELGTHAFTEDEIITFASQWDPQYFHVDPVRAEAESRFGGLIASGLHTLSVYQRLSVLARRIPWNVIAGAGMEDVALLRPVRPGNVLRGRTVVEGIQLQPDRQRGLVTFVGELTNQDDKPVLRLTMTAFLAMRPL